MLKNILMFIVGLLIGFMLMILMMTPDKTNSGEYTNAWKYWTSDAYFNTNFVKGD